MPTLKELFKMARDSPAATMLALAILVILGMLGQRSAFDDSKERLNEQLNLSLRNCSDDKLAMQRIYHEAIDSLNARNNAEKLKFTNESLQRMEILFARLRKLEKK